MKFNKILASVLAIGIILPTFGALKVNADSVVIDANSFPDPAFLTYVLENIDNGDGVLSSSEISHTTYMQLGFLGITDLTGITNFTSLKTLDCESNGFTELNVSNMTSLESIHCGGGQVTTINIDGCTSLTTLSSWGNSVSSVNLAGAPNLTLVDFNSNNLTGLDVSSNLSLETLRLNGNPNLGSIDVSSNTALKYLDVNNCGLSSLNVENNLALVELMFSDNNISEINLENNTELSMFSCSNNPCDEYDVTNSSNLVTAMNDGYLYIDGTTYLYEYAEGEDYFAVTCSSEDVVIPGKCEVTSKTPEEPDGNDVIPAGNGVEGFLNRLYQVSLDRNADQDGRQFWIDMINSEKETGVSTAYHFFFSPEYIAKNRSNEEFVTDLYTAFLGRSASNDATGFEFWVTLLNNGTSRERVLADFANSQEFFDLCRSYGILCGTYEPNKDIIKTVRINYFVERLYTTIHGRKSDREGMNFWSTGLLNGRLTGISAANSFIFSSEYMSKNKTDNDFLTDLYRVLFGRNPDEGGMNYWRSTYTFGNVDRDIFNGMATSNEFTAICNSYGITRGNAVKSGSLWARNNKRELHFRVDAAVDSELATKVTFRIYDFPSSVTATITCNGKTVATKSGTTVVYSLTNKLVPTGEYKVTFTNAYGRVVGTKTITVNQRLNSLVYGHPVYGASTTDFFKNTGDWFLYDYGGNKAITNGTIPSSCSKFQLTAQVYSGYNEQIRYTWYYSANGDFSSATVQCTALVKPTRLGQHYYYDCNNTSSASNKTGDYWCVITNASTNEVYVVMRCHR